MHTDNKHSRYTNAHYCIWTRANWRAKPTGLDQCSDFKHQLASQHLSWIEYLLVACVGDIELSQSSHVCISMSSDLANLVTPPIGFGCSAERVQGWCLVCQSKTRILVAVIKVHFVAVITL